MTRIARYFWTPSVTFFGVEVSVFTPSIVLAPLASMLGAA